MYKAHIHYDEGIEMVILGSCLNENDGMARVRNILEPHHFYFEPNKVIYQLLCDMWDDGEMIDLLIVVSNLVRNGLWKFDELYGKASYYCQRLSMSVLSTAHLERHAIIVRQLYMEREVIRIQSSVGKGDGDGIEKLTTLQDEISNMLNLKSTDDWHDMSYVMMQLVKHMDEVKGNDNLGIPTGIPIIDAALYGFEKKDLIIIGARPSVGKSAFAGNIAHNMAKSGYKVGIISLEMPEVKIGGRIASIYSDIAFWRIYKNIFVDNEQERMALSKISEAATLPIYFTDKTNVTLSDIRSKAYKLMKKNKMDILMIDYLQLIETKSVAGETRDREVGKLSRGLKLIAMDLNIPVVVLCQLNRQSEGRTNKKPRLSDLRESGSLEQDADKVLLLHRDWKSGIQQDEHGNSTERQASVIIEKNRNGECMEITLAFDPDQMKFEEMDNSSPVKFIPDNPSAGISKPGINENWDNQIF